VDANKVFPSREKQSSKLEEQNFDIESDQVSSIKESQPSQISYQMEENKAFHTNQIGSGNKNIPDEDLIKCNVQNYNDEQWRDLVEVKLSKYRNDLLCYYDFTKELFCSLRYLFWEKTNARILKMLEIVLQKILTKSTLNLTLDVGMEEQTLTLQIDLGI
jgi:hypothetical protein